LCLRQGLLQQWQGNCFVSPRSLFSRRLEMGAVRSRSGRVTATLVALAIVLAIAAEITALQAEETSLAPAQVPTTTSTRVTSTTSGLHDITFLVSSQCGGRPSGWTINEWAVTLGNATKTYPLNTTLSQIQSGGPPTLGGTDLASSITFAVPNGTYSFQLYPNGSEYGAQGPLEVISAPSGEEEARGATGVITVSGFDLEFCLSYPAIVA
jgi:FlaG/FlaF family flagellin (archaellin)